MGIEEMAQLVSATPEGVTGERSVSDLAQSGISGVTMHRRAAGGRRASDVVGDYIREIAVGTDSLIEPWLASIDADQIV